MMIGFSVQGSTDRALVRGLKDRWCPSAGLIEGSFRGTTRQSLRREYQKICDELAAKGATAMIFITDGDGADWRTVLRNERQRFPQGRLIQSVHGVADRNIECWICADPAWLAQQVGENALIFRTVDPKQAFERALGINRDDKKEDEIADLVRRAPVRSWLSNASFEDFYERIRDLSQLLGCEIQNERERNA